MNAKASFYNLHPDKVMLAAEHAGFLPTGEFTQLNSYENRVFDLRLENRERVIVKFYRPQRWTRDAILEEHEFLAELAGEGIPAVAALKQANGSTLSENDGLWTAFFPKALGRLPDEIINADLPKVGRLLAQVHNIGGRRRARHRLTLTPQGMRAWDNLEFLQDWIAPEIRNRYNDAAQEVLETFEDRVDPSEFQRIHGDCHRGNLLNDGKSFFLVDFDDFVTGPVVHDFWMLLPGDPADYPEERDLMLKGYEELREFPHHQWEWIPLLRGLRIINYSAWIAHRWEDPSFPKLFPNFRDYVFWAEEVEALEKIAWSLK